MRAAQACCAPGVSQERRVSDAAARTRRWRWRWDPWRPSTASQQAGRSRPKRTACGNVNTSAVNSCCAYNHDMQHAHVPLRCRWRCSGRWRCRSSRYTGSNGRPTRCRAAGPSAPASGTCATRSPGSSAPGSTGPERPQRQQQREKRASVRHVMSDVGGTVKSTRACLQRAAVSLAGGVELAEVVVVQARPGLQRGGRRLQSASRGMGVGMGMRVSPLPHSAARRSRWRVTRTAVAHCVAFTSCGYSHTQDSVLLGSSAGQSFRQMLFASAKSKP